MDCSISFAAAVHIRGPGHSDLVMGVVTVLRTPTDIFPNINIPVVSIIWNYNGLVPREMSDRIVSITERNLTTVVDNIEHVESQSLYGVAVVKVFLQPNARIGRAIAQTAASSQTQLRQLPAGTTPPLIIAYSASSVPVMQLALSGQGLSEQQLNDYGLNFIRTQLITVPGTAVPYPGGKQRQVQVDLNPGALQSKGLSALDVVNAISAQDLILPTGTSKIGSKAYNVDIPNSAPQTIADLNRIPIKTVGNTTIYMKDVVWVRGGFPANQHRACEWTEIDASDDPEDRRCRYARTSLLAFIGPAVLVAPQPQALV